MLSPIHGLKKNPLAKAIAITVASSLLAPYALAQEVEEESARGQFTLEEIIVQGTKRAMDIQDVPQSMTAFSTDEIAKRGFGNTQDFAKSIPGLSTVTTVPGRNEIVFRGVSQGTGEWRLDSSSAVYLGAVPMTSATQSIDPRTVDLASIESLPGPQGTRYGSSSQSGALVYIPNKPDHSVREAEVSISGTHMKEGDPGHSAEAWVNIPIIEDKLTLRAVVYDVKDGGYVDNVLGENIFSDDTNADVVEDNYNTWEQKGVRLSALWSVNERWDAELMYLNQRSNSKGDMKSDPNAPGHDDYDIVRFFKDERADDWWLASLTLTGDLGFAELSYSTSVVDREIAYEFDGNLDGQIRAQQAEEYYFGDPNFYLADGVTANPDYDQYAYFNNSLYHTGFRPETSVNDQTNDRVTHEIRLFSQNESRFQWMLGAFYEDANDEWNYSYARVEGLPETRVGYIIDYYGLEDTDDWYYEEYLNNVKQVAVFGEMSYELTEQLSVGFGVRWFEAKRSRWEQKEFPRGKLVPFDEYKAKESDTIYMFDVQYAFNDDINTYFHYSEGPRLGGENSFKKPNSVLPKSYDSDFLKNHEVGMKSEWLGNRLQLNVAYYMMDWGNMQSTITDPDDYSNSGTINFGDAELSGLEATLKYQVTEHFYVDAGYNISNSELKKDRFLSELVALNDPAFQEEQLGAKGQQLPINPDTKWSIGLEYEIPGLFGNVDFWARYDHYWQAEMYHDWWNAMNDEIDGSGNKLIEDQESGDFQVSLSVDNDWSLTLSVWNVWDDRNAWWIDSGYDYAFGAEGNWKEQGGGRYVNMPGYQPPREFELSFTKRFD